MTNAVKHCGKSAVVFGALVAIGVAVSMNARAASVTPPTVTAPTVTAPTVTAPTVTVPTVKTPSVTAPAVNTPTVPATGMSTCGSQLKVVKKLWKNAPAGPNKDTAKTHYDQAVAASKKQDDKTCLSELDAASAALK